MVVWPLAGTSQASITFWAMDSNMSCRIFAGMVVVDQLQDPDGDHVVILIQFWRGFGKKWKNKQKNSVETEKREGKLQLTENW